MRWIWIDRFTDFQSKQSARAVKNLSMAEDLFRDHFPGYPVMPASLILEGLAQTGGILVGEANNFQEKVVLAKIGQAKFHREVLAGEQLIYDVKLLDIRPEAATVRGTVTSGADLIAEAEFMFAHLDKSRAGAIFGDDNFVFAGQLSKMLGLSKLRTDAAPSANSGSPSP